MRGAGLWLLKTFQHSQTAASKTGLRPKSPNEPPRVSHGFIAAQIRTTIEKEKI
jgi:hypothetical protein